MLTEAQHSRLDRMPDECRVVGSDRFTGHPIISYPSGNMQTIDHTGRLRKASMRVRIEIGKRRIERATA